MPLALLSGLDRWRRILKDAGVVGENPDGIGFGNLSARIGRTAVFIITGSATGGLAHLDERHYALVDGYDFERNSLSCKGLTRASSESLSHAALYAALPEVGAVIHIHSAALWNRAFGVLPTTAPEAEYGTPEMAREIERIAGGNDIRLPGIVIMGGHRDGIVSFGRDIESAGSALMEELSSCVS